MEIPGVGRVDAFEDVFVVSARCVDAFEANSAAETVNGRQFFETILHGSLELPLKTLGDTRTPMCVGLAVGILMGTDVGQWREAGRARFPEMRPSAGNAAFKFPEHRRRGCVIDAEPIPVDVDA